MTETFSISIILNVPDLKPAAKSIPLGLPDKQRQGSLDGYGNSYVCSNF